jgi:hypothetical protein
MQMIAMNDGDFVAEQFAKYIFSDSFMGERQDYARNL